MTTTKTVPTTTTCAGCGRALTDQTAHIDAPTGDIVCATCRMDREDFRQDHPGKKS